MKIKEEYVLYNAKDDETIAVATGKEAKNFKGLLRANEAATFIMNCLKEETTEEEILDKLTKEYDADREVLSKDLSEVLETLRRVGALVE